MALLESSVAPGGTGTFVFWYTVPPAHAGGVFREYFRPVADGIRWLEDYGVYWDVTVVAPRGFDYPVGTPDGNGWLNNRNGYWWLERAYYGPSCGWVYHPGVDFNRDGTSGDGDRYEPVYAVADGVVVGSAYYGTSTWGNVILIEHTLADGTRVWSQYGHLEDRWVSTGARVTRRQQIGRVGKGDGTLYAHLHFEIRKVLMAPNAFPCGQPISYVTDRYHDPIAFINTHR